MAADTEEGGELFSALTELSGLRQPQLYTVQTPQKNYMVTSAGGERKFENLLTELDRIKK